VIRSRPGVDEVVEVGVFAAQAQSEQQVVDEAGLWGS
jgi:hypothetical protein